MSMERLLEEWQGGDGYEGSEKRRFSRLVWPPEERPSLKIKGHQLKIIDTSERGLKLAARLKRKTDKKINGTVEFSSGASVNVTGKVAWLSNDSFGMQTTAIPQSTLIDEIRKLIRKLGSLTGGKVAEKILKIVCPSCSFEQGQSDECINCGIIISKYEAKQAPETPETATSTRSTDDEDGTTGTSSKKVLGYKWILSKIIPQQLEYFFRNAFSRRNPYYRYVAKVMDITIQAVILFLISSLVYTVLLYMCELAWGIYISTPVGKKFIATFSKDAQIIFDLFRRNLLFLSVQLTWAAFIVCLAVSAICQVFHIARYLYQGRGFFGNLFLWGLPLAAVVAYQTRPVFGFESLGIAYGLALVPTIFVFSGCFKFTHELLPELGEFFKGLLQLKTKIAERRIS